MKDSSDGHTGTWKLDSWITEGWYNPFNAREGLRVGLTWSSLLDLSTMSESQSEVWFRSVKCNNVSLEHERRNCWTHWYLGAS